MPRSAAAAAAPVLALALCALLPVGVAEAAAPASAFTNCTALQRVYPHGLGTPTAVDHTSGRPVTTFQRDDKEFARAMSVDKGLDRDKDKVACEKR